MKKLLALILLSSLSIAQGENIKFSLSCEVTGQVLIETKDGKATTYTSYKDEIQNGDLFNIEFDFFKYINSYDLMFSAEKLYFIGAINSDDSEGIDTGLRFRNKSRLFDAGMWLDGIRYELLLRRYFKNDYELMFSEGISIGKTTRTLTANCMNMPSEYDEMISEIKAFDKDKWGNSKP